MHGGGLQYAYMWTIIFIEHFMMLHFKFLNNNYIFLFGVYLLLDWPCLYFLTERYISMCQLSSIKVMMQIPDNKRKYPEKNKFLSRSGSICVLRFIVFLE